MGNYEFNKLKTRGFCNKLAYYTCLDYCFVKTYYIVYIPDQLRLN